MAKATTKRKPAGARKTAKSAARKPVRRAKAAKPPAYRLTDPADEGMSEPQRALRDAIMAGPRGQRKSSTARSRSGSRRPSSATAPSGSANTAAITRPWSHACRSSPSSPPARLWKAQYEWFAHEPMALKAGVKPATIKDLKAGRAPKSAPRDERAIYEFIQELYKTKRVSDRTYKRVRAFLDDGAIVELVGILGYYALISMTLNTFHAPLPEGETLPFAEPR